MIQEIETKPKDATSPRKTRHPVWRWLRRHSQWALAVALAALAIWNAFLKVEQNNQAAASNVFREELEKLEVSEKEDAVSKNRFNGYQSTLVEYGRCFGLGFLFYESINDLHSDKRSKIHCEYEVAMLQRISDSLELNMKMDDLCKPELDYSINDETKITPVNAIFLTILNQRKDSSCLYFRAGVQAACLDETSNLITNDAKKATAAIQAEMQECCDCLEPMVKGIGYHYALSDPCHKGDWALLHSNVSSLYIDLIKTFLSSVKDPFRDNQLKLDPATLRLIQ
jgi:hypothetical protein